MPAPRVACSARRSAARLRETSPKATPSLTRTSHHSMPSLRPFNHNPPSDIGVSSFLNSVLYDRTGVFFGNSIAFPPFTVVSQSSDRAVVLGVLAFSDDLRCPREPVLLAHGLHHKEDDDADAQPECGDQRS